MLEVEDAQEAVSSGLVSACVMTAADIAWVPAAQLGLSAKLTQFMARHATDVIFVSSRDFVSNPVNSNTKETDEVNTTEPKDTDQEPSCHHKWLCTGFDSHSGTNFYVCRHCRAECEIYE